MLGRKLVVIPSSNRGDSDGLWQSGLRGSRVAAVLKVLEVSKWMVGSVLGTRSPSSEATAWSGDIWACLNLSCLIGVYQYYTELRMGPYNIGSTWWCSITHNLRLHLQEGPYISHYDKRWSKVINGLWPILCHPRRVNDDFNQEGGG